MNIEHILCLEIYVIQLAIRKWKMYYFENVFGTTNNWKSQNSFAKFMHLGVIWQFRIQFVLSNHFKTLFNSIVELMYWKWTENVVIYEKWQNEFEIGNWKTFIEKIYIAKSPLQRWYGKYMDFRLLFMHCAKPKFCIRHYSIQLEFATSKFGICGNSCCTTWHHVEWNWFVGNLKFWNYRLIHVQSEFLDWINIWKLPDVSRNNYCSTIE